MFKSYRRSNKAGNNDEQQFNIEEVREMVRLEVKAEFARREALRGKEL